jgi:predicted DNA-binding antitoxin AbrB/MazE fold protein
MQHLEAVFEDGVLRPLGPLSLPEKQHVMLTITDVPVPVSPKASRLPEQEWLRLHSEEFANPTAIEFTRTHLYTPSTVSRSQ